MDSLAKDLRFALRSLRKSAGLSAIAIVVLTLGIGANTAIFSVVDSVLLRPLPYPDANRIVTIDEAFSDGSSDAPAPADFLQLEDEAHSFDAMAAYTTSWLNVAGDTEPERLSGAVVSRDFFRVLGTQPVIGRTEFPEDTAERVVVLSDGLWKSHFAGATGVVGRTMRIGGESCTIIGVMPAAFAFPDAAELWMSARFRVPEHPLQPTIDPSPSHERHYFDVIGRVSRGVTVDAARAELQEIAARITAENPTIGDARVRLADLHESMVGSARPMLLMLFGAVGFVLLITCANVANLLFGRAASRRKEMATRAALGASRIRLVRQLLVESLLLSSIGGGLGLLLAVWTVRPLAKLAPSQFLTSPDPSLDWRVLLFAACASLLTAVAFGLLPAIHASRVDLNDVLKDATRGSTGGIRQNRTRSTLVVGEIAVSLVLLIGAGLMVKSLARLSAVDPGFDGHDLATVQVSLPAGKYSDGSAKALFFSSAIDRVRAIPGVVGVAATTRIPLSGGNSSRSIEIAGYVPASSDDQPNADYRAVSADYYTTMKIPLRAGREFTEQDSATSAPVCVVNEAFTRRYLAGVEPIGARVRISGSTTDREIVGVVGDVRHADLATAARPELAVPFEQDPWPFMTLAIRTTDTARLSAQSMRDAIRSVDPDQPIARLATMDELRSKSIEPREFGALLLAMFAALALVLVVIGVYGVVSFAASERTHEIGIRMALGASASDVLRLILGHGAALALIGVGCGVVAALALTRVIAGLLFQVQPADPAVFTSVAAVLVVVAVLASAAPAIRAARSDPMKALHTP